MNEKKKLNLNSIVNQPKQEIKKNQVNDSKNENQMDEPADSVLFIPSVEEAQYDNRFGLSLSEKFRNLRV